jgi:hypothetical protein
MSAGATEEEKTGSIERDNADPGATSEHVHCGGPETPDGAMQTENARGDPQTFIDDADASILQGLVERSGCGGTGSENEP